MSGRRRSAFFGVLFGYTGLVISLARNILFVPLYLQKIPMAEYGAWLATGGALALILINDYGLSGVVTQRLSSAYGAGDVVRLGRLTGASLAVGGALSAGLSAISLAFVPFLPALKTLTPTEVHTVAACFVFAVVANGLGVIGATAGSVLRSLQRVVVGGAITLAAEICNVLAILIGLFKGYGLYAIAAGVLVRAAVLTTGNLLCVWIVCHRVLNSRIRIVVAEVRDLIGESSRFFLSSIAIRLLAQANVLFVGLVLGPAAAAIYSLTVRAYDTVVMVIVLFNGSLVPSITHLFGSGNLARFREVVMRVLIGVAALTALAMTVTVVLDPAFLHLWVGDAAFGGQSVSVMTAAALFASLIGGVAYDALVAQGKFGVVSRLYVVSSVLQVILLSTLLRLGMWVAPFATLAVSGVWGAGFWWIVSRDLKLVGAEIRGLLLELGRLVGASIATAGIFTAFYPPPGSWLAFALEGGVCALVASGGYLAASAKLRQLVFEEVGTTWRMLRAI
jgi:O-antigen/teichoic acid export membrane protein